MSGISKISGRILLAVAVALAVVALVGMVLVRGGESKPTVTAEFTDASPLVAGNLIKIDGVEVGLIKSIELRNGRARVTMELDDSVLPLHQDASAKIRSKSLLGERYIDLERGSDSAPAMDLPGSIPVERTGRSTDVQDVLDTVDDPTGTALSALLTTLGEGTSGQGANIRAALKALEPAMQDTGKLGDVLNEQNDVLVSLLDRVTPVAESLSRNNGANLDSLVGSAEKTLSSVAERRAALDTTLQRLPGTLRTARSTLRELAGLSTDTAGTLKSLRPVTDDLPTISDELNNFVNSANPALASLPPVLKKAETLIGDAMPLVRALKPGTSSLASISKSARPIVRDLEPRLDIVLTFMKYWALSTNGRDGVGNYFRGAVADSPQNLLQIPGLSMPNQSAPNEPSEKSPDTGDPKRTGSGDSDDIGTSPKRGAPNEGATGLDPEQEKNLVEQLLGGS